MKRFRWGIFGTGAISARFVAGLAAARGAEATFVASRDKAKAEAFAAGMGIGRAIAGYEEAIAQGGVDAIYIATPPALHAPHALMCIEASIPVLVEKPFAASAAEAQMISEAARTRGVFAMEAMWTRFLPAARALRDEVAAETIGEARFITGNFGVSERPEPTNGLFDPALGGGAVAHLGAYPLSIGQWLFGNPILEQAIGTMGATGVDEDAAFQLRYANGAIGSFLVSLRAWAPDSFAVLGTEGRIELEGHITRPYGLTVTRQAPRTAAPPSFGWKDRLGERGLIHRLKQLRPRRHGDSVAHRYEGNGFHYEADEVRTCIERGAIESMVMPLDDSIAVARTADAIRAAIHRQA